MVAALMHYSDNPSSGGSGSNGGSRDGKKHVTFDIPTTTTTTTTTGSDGRNRILVCAQSNPAVDELLKRFLKGIPGRCSVV